MKPSKLFHSFKFIIHDSDGTSKLNLRLRAHSMESNPADSTSSSTIRGDIISVADAAMSVGNGYYSDANGEDGFDAESENTSTNGEESDDDEDNNIIEGLDSSIGSKEHVLDSKALLANLGPSPTEEQIAMIAAARAHEYIVECFDESSMLDKERFEAIPTYAKSDLVIGQYLGKGSFSDAFEVTLTATMQPTSVRAFETDFTVHDKGDGQDIDVLMKKASSRFRGNDTSHDWGVTSKPIPLSTNRRPPRRASTTPFSKSVCMGTVNSSVAHEERRLTLAMKCLRPQIRASPEQFLIGVEDLIHETAMLASLDHPNIIKIHGRSGGSLSDSFKTNGYFILLDRLVDTLEDRITRWKKTTPLAGKTPSLNQVMVASSLAGAISFLHHNRIVFRDLKPANVGFDARGVLKLFDFGFAVAVEEENPKPLHDRCGTLRYMAPEVGLALGYGIEADTYSFGMLLWEICSLKKPFSKVKSANEFETLVFTKSKRPKLRKKWPVPLKDLTSQCWSKDPTERPAMSVVKSTLTAMAQELSTRPLAGNSFTKSIRSSITRRMTWD